MAAPTCRSTRWPTQLSSRIRFSYKGTPRLVHPGTVRLQNYQWYLSGIEDGHDRIKHFAVSRMSNASLDKPDTLGRRADTTVFQFSGDSAFILESGRAVKHLSPFLTKQLRFMLSTAKDWTEIKRRLALPDSIPGS